MSVPRKETTGDDVERKHYASETVILFLASIIDRSPSSAERCDLTRMSVFHIEMDNKFFDR